MRMQPLRYRVRAKRQGHNGRRFIGQGSRLNRQACHVFLHIGNRRGTPANFHTMLRRASVWFSPLHNQKQLWQ